jgi:hypothetical protein
VFFSEFLDFLGTLDTNRRHSHFLHRTFHPTLARDSTPMRSPRPFDSGDESTTTQHISSGAIRFSTSVPESVQLCQKLFKSPPIMATNGDAGRGTLATQYMLPGTRDRGPARVALYAEGFELVRAIKC